MNATLQEWKQNQRGNYWRESPEDNLFRWHVSKRETGWFWYTIHFGNTSTIASGESGPFTSWMSAAADCTSYHKVARS